MNPDFPARLAAQLRDNPSLFDEMDDSLLGQLLFHYHENELNAEDVVEVEAQLQTNPKAKAIYQRIEAADQFATSPAGKTWLESLRNRALPPLTVAPQAAIAPAFFDCLSEWMAGLFPSLTLQATYSDTTAGSVVHKFDAPASDPYRARLVRDAAGQWRLRVSTCDSDAAKLKLRLEIEAEAPVLSFVAGEPGHFLAEVLLTEEMAQALQSGHRPVFRPIE